MIKRVFCILVNCSIWVFSLSSQLNSLENLEQLDKGGLKKTLSGFLKTSIHLEIHSNWEGDCLSTCDPMMQWEVRCDKILSFILSMQMSMWKSTRSIFRFQWYWLQKYQQILSQLFRFEGIFKRQHQQQKEWIR